MSVLIKGLTKEKVESCFRFAKDGWCIFDMPEIIEVPTPHGRLIDTDTLKARVQKLQEWLWDKLTDADVGIVTADDVRYRIAEEFEEFIDDAPTIIESEGEDESR